MFNRKSIHIVLLSLLILAVVFTPALAGSGITTLISWGEDGGKTKNGDSYIHSLPATSADGRYVVFSSTATNVVQNDTNAKMDVFVRDRQTNTNIRVSVDSSGAQANNNSSSASISADGRYVAFWSDATNLVAGDVNNVSDIFVRDLVDNTTTLVSVNNAGIQANSGSSATTISANGRFVVFWSSATNLVTDKTNSVTDIFVRDLKANTTQRVSLATNGTQGNGNSSAPSISADGRYVAFISTSNNLVSNDTNFAPDIFVRDLVQNITERVSVATDGSQADGNFASYDVSIPPSISYDGRYVAFYSPATNLVIGDTNNYNDIFVHDRQAGTTTIVSIGMDSEEADSESRAASISADGRYVAFQSLASNLVSGDTNGYGIYDIFVRDRVLNSTRRVSVASDDTQQDHTSTTPAISADGHAVVFASLGRTLVTPVTLINDGQQHIFMFDTGSIPECYPLTLNFTGPGAAPTAAPGNSENCPAGQYHVGAAITLAAHPDGDNSVLNWSGSNYDASTSESNTATMPAGPLTVTVNYGSLAVGIPSPLTPDGAITAASPKFTWTKIGDATQYQVVLFNSGSTVMMDKTVNASACATDCSYTPSPALALTSGSYEWKVRAFKSVWGEYSALKAFSKVSPPAPATISPSGSIDITKPTFIWSRISNATSYLLNVYNTTTSQDVYTTPVSTSACSSSTGQCKFTPSTTLVYNNNYRWKIQAKSSAGISDYSAPVDFSPVAEIPAVPVTQTPNGIINDIKPAYVWTRISIATTYKLVVTEVGATKNLIDMSVSSSNCSTSTNLCTYTPSTALGQYKDYEWKVMATSAKGVSSPYSSPRAVRSVLAVPVAQTPDGDIATIKPAYVWSRVLNATTYKLTVYDIAGGSNVIEMNVSSSACSSSTNKCTYTPSTALTSDNEYRWKVVAANSSGSSPESNTLNFKPLPPATPVTESPAGNIFTTKPAYIWSRVDNATSYNLVVNDGIAVKDLINLKVSSSYCSITTNKCTYTPSTALRLYKDYQWKVLASNAAGNSLFTGNVNIRSILAVPVPATPAGNIGVRKPSYVWSRVLGATTYRLTVFDVVGGSNVIEMNVSSSSCSTSTNKCTYTPAYVLAPSQEYRWKVYAGSTYGNSDESSPVSFSPVPPVAPVAETPTGNITTTKPAYVWTRVDNTTTYNLVVVDVAANKTVVNLSVSSSYCSTVTNKCTYTPSTSLSLYKNYQWKVLAANAVGSSLFSNILSFKPILPTPVPYTPTGNIGTLKPAYVWSRISGATSYMLTVDDSGGTNLITQTVGSSFCSSSTNKCTFTPSTELTLNNDYRWKVYAFNILGVSAESGFVNFKPIPPAVPVTDSPAGDITTLKPTYIWLRISDANTYKLVVHDVAGAVDIIDLSVSKSYCSTTTNLCKYTPSTYLSLDKTYQWKVKAVNAAGLSSDYSGAVNIKPVRPTTPTTFTPSGNITVTKPPYVWSRVSTATSYKLYIIDVLAAKTILTATVSSSYCSTVTDRCTYTPSTTLTRNKDYQWKVEAVSAGGLISLPSGLVNFRVIY